MKNTESKASIKNENVGHHKMIRKQSFKSKFKQLTFNNPTKSYIFY